ncbi:hypothetical protein PE066_14760 [Ramlibacter tataouinensis]|uniref:hypothetical protein n=1 Tax=Ramlibacter tataouinensis TaxID=94132 RepID=UPI0022F3DA16|nr:hypothetical protein [Ramlibacter tataouinensis]WBY00718.1 hypothetical protein PE066_14760 [Ramlibacter tataouinensis]
MNVLVLYHSTQTFTNTVFEHLNSLERFSRHRYFFCHHDAATAFHVDLTRFDAIVVHYSLRLPYDQISDSLASAMAGYVGLKALFIQDEYDNTHRTWNWIRRLGFQLVFTVVPQAHIATVYPPAEFPGVRFVSNLTGYVPESLSAARNVPPPSTRSILIGYRGRPLPLRYGQLGFEKVSIGRMVRAWCQQHAVPCDIAWDEESRIYGPAWYDFMVSCRAMLGSESGSNVFDWEGDLEGRIAAYRDAHPGVGDEQVYRTVVEPRELPGLMNQVSPRVFEAISSRTVLVLFEGSYSGVVEPGRHYIALRKDGSNLAEVVALLRDDAYVDAMAERAWQDVIGSGRYGFPQWVSWVDSEMESALRSLPPSTADGVIVTKPDHPDGWFDRPAPMTTHPLRFRVVTAPVRSQRWRGMAVAGWAFVPLPLRPVLRPIVRGVLLPGLRMMQRIMWRRRRRT